MDYKQLNKEYYNLFLNVKIQKIKIKELFYC